MSLRQPTAADSPLTGSPIHSAARGKRLIRLMVMAVVYAIWLCVLGYIAWVNVQSGNQ
ncbi:MAG: hypothetical protein KDA51_17610 [Planctomycetales bacterium]|nr:hypothetical protein [Planctomycetales bacterium]MCA9183285.1 hypothetical protein [Planctomycetales bacterium]